jgi:hypothetical protein
VKKTKDKEETRKALPEQIFSLWKAASTDEERPQLRCVRIEPGSAMATDGHILLKIIPADKFGVNASFSVDADMCAQVLKARALSGEGAVINLMNGTGPLSLSVGAYTFLPTAQLELFEYEPILEQKINKIGEVGFLVSTFEKLLRSLKALGVTGFRMELGGETQPVKIEANIDGMDRVTGAIMPARV